MSKPSLNEQKYVYPADPFVELGDQITTWTCVRTRPRWEKKFSRWLTAKQIPHFLPTYRKETISHRKRRESELALFPGYVFVVGDHVEKDFSKSGTVVYLLKPRSEAESRQLCGELSSVWLGLAQGSQPVPVLEPVKGEMVEVLSGPLMGTIGRFEKKGKGGRLILWIDMLGAGASVEVTSDIKVRLIT